VLVKKVRRTRLFRTAAIGVLLFSGFAASQQPAAPPARNGQGQAQKPARKQLLVWADTRGGGGYHDSVSHAMAVLERMGRESGIYDAYLRTDSQLITKGPIVVNADGRDWSTNKNLNWFDAIFFLGLREIPITDQQKADLLAFVKEDGKGFVAAHAGNNAFMTWPAYAEMIGAASDGYPWGTQADANYIVEDPAFPAMRGFPPTFRLRDEPYQLSQFSREKIHVLLRLDTSSVDMKLPGVHRTDNDFPQAWAKASGKGRVFVCAFGQTIEVWDRPEIQTMWMEAIKWAMGLTQADVTPMPMPVSKTSAAAGKD
jgi:type 1 glutamine amidotransferase